MAYLTYTMPAAGVHPRLWMSDLHGPTVASVRSRATESHVYYYNKMKSWYTSGYPNHLSDSNSSYASRDQEFTMGLAFTYLMEGTTTFADKAISIALYLANTVPPDDNYAKRHQLLSMAAVYDWCYPRMTSSQRTQLIQPHSGYGGLTYNMHYRIQQLGNLNPDEYMWGHSHGNHVFTMASLCAVVNDGADSTVNAQWQTWLEQHLDSHANGTNTASHGAVLRYFGDTDGGTWKGAGSYSYSVGTEEFYQSCLQNLKSALGIDYWTLDPWWSKLIDWHIWHWRSDGSFHNQNDGLRLARTREQTQIHALMVAEHEIPNPYPPPQTGTPSALGFRAWWLNKEIEYQAQFTVPPAYAIWGPYHIHNVMHRPMDTDYYPETHPLPYQPTTDGVGPATYGTSRMRIFNPAKKIIYRSGWNQEVSVTVSGQRFTGDHSHRDAGHIELCVNQVPILGRHGYYDPSQRQTWQNQAEVQASPPILTNSGHTFTYYHRACAHSVMRINDSDEVVENETNSVLYQFNADSSFFGYKTPAGTKVVSYIGDLLWPHDVDLHKYQPQDLTHFLSKAYWDIETIAGSSETSTYAYIVLNLKDLYYASKCTRYKRHVLCIKPGEVNVQWQREIVVVWDDLNVPIDATYQEKSTIQQWQILKKPGVFVYGPGNLLSCVIVRGAGRLQMQWLKPSSAPYQVIDGFADANGVIYPPSKTDSCSDSKIADNVSRIEVWQPSSTTTPQYLTVLSPYGSESDSVPVPIASIFEDSNYIGVNFALENKQFLFKKGDEHAIVFSSTEEPLPPPTQPMPPTGLVATGGSNSVVLDWNDNAETDLDFYRVYRQTKVAEGIYSSWSLIYSPEPSLYTDTSAINGTTYRYKVTAVNTSALESLDSAISNEVTPATPPPPPPPAPPDPGASDNRKLSIGQHPMTCTIPVPSTDAVMTEGDKFQFMWVYSGIDAGPPPVDYSTGTEIELPSPIGGSCLIDSTTGDSGATIETAEPATAVSGEEIEDAVV